MKTQTLVMSLLFVAVMTLAAVVACIVRYEMFVVRGEGFGLDRVYRLDGWTGKVDVSTPMGEQWREVGMPRKPSETKSE